MHVVTPKRLRIWLAAGIYLVFLFTSSGGFETGDASRRYEVARSWLAGSGGALPTSWGWDGGAFGPDGRVYSIYGPLQSALMVPFISLVRLVLHGAADTSVVETFVISLGLFPLVSTIAVMLAFLAIQRLGFSDRQCVAAALAIAIASLFWHYARMGQEENLLALGFALWLYGASRLATGAGWCATWMGVGTCVAITTRWASLPTLGVLFLTTMFLLWGERQDRRGLRRLRAADAVLGASLAALGVVTVLVYNHQRFGAWLETGYGLLFRHYGWALFSLDDYPAHVAALLASPSRGLFLYSPLVLLAIVGSFLSRPRGPVHILSLGALAAFAAVLLAISGFHFWKGGHAWGPRFFASLHILLAPALAQFFARWPRAAVLIPILAAIQITSTMLPESTEEYVWFNLENTKPGYCTDWTADCTPVGQRLPRVATAIMHTVRGQPGITLTGRPIVAPEIVLSTSDYRTVYWWPFRIAFRLQRISLAFALALCLSGLTSALICLLVSWTASRPLSVRTPSQVIRDSA